MGAAYFTMTFVLGVVGIFATVSGIYHTDRFDQPPRINGGRLDRICHYAEIRMSRPTNC